MSEKQNLNFIPIHTHPFLGLSRLPFLLSCVVLHYNKETIFERRLQAARTETPNRLIHQSTDWAPVLMHFNGTFKYRLRVQHSTVK